jgi:hypothetical protein
MVYVPFFFGYNMASYNGIVDGVLHPIAYWMECFSGLRLSF